MNDFYEALEICLKALDDGSDLESVLAKYPRLAHELRPILEASIAARSMVVPGPSTEAIQHGRARVLQRASQLREERAPAPRRVIPVFQRLSLALTIAIVFLLSGTGLVRASSTALPGEGLYPVKRTLEGVRLFFIFDPGQRQALEGEYENERLDEIGKLLNEGRHESIQFAGVVMDVNGIIYVSGIRVVIMDTTQLPADVLQTGSAVIVTGRTNAEGFVEAESVAALPPGSLVPVGNPIALEAEGDSSGSGSGGGDAGSVSGPQPASDVKYFKVEGTVDSLSNGTVVINGQTVYLDQAQVSGNIVVGVSVEAEGYFGADGRFIVTEIEVERPEPERDSGNDNSNSDDEDQKNNDDNDNNDNDNDDHNDNEDGSHDGNDNDSGGGGGDDD